MTDKVAIVGAGLVGAGWAIVFARAGLDVWMYDNVKGVAEQALTTISSSLSDLEAAGLIDAALPIFSRIAVASSLKQAVAGARYVQESVLEQLEIKRSIFSELDAVIGPNTIIGSSSSGIPSSSFTDHIVCRDRCLIAHPLNPPYLAPIVELVPAPWTSSQTVAHTRVLMEAVGQSPVEMAWEAEGFILNRLQGVLLMEAWRIVESGLASVEDVDKTVSQGLGLRWSFLGPFQTIDLNAPGGVADYASRLSSLYQRIAASTESHQVWSADLVAKVEAQLRRGSPEPDLSQRRAWRDRRLMALAKHKLDLDALEAEEGRQDN